MKSMLRNACVFFILVVTVVATLMIKHVPFQNLVALSSLLVLLGSLFAAGIVLGFRNVLLAFLGRSTETAEAMIRIIFLSTCLWAVVCATGAFVNLSTPDYIGPNISGAFVVGFYGLFLAGYLAIANKATKLANQFIYFSGGIIFTNVALIMVVLYAIKS